MVWPTLGRRTAKEQNSCLKLVLVISTDRLKFPQLAVSLRFLFRHSLLGVGLTQLTTYSSKRCDEKQESMSRDWEDKAHEKSIFV